MDFLVQLLSFFDFLALIVGGGILFIKNKKGETVVPLFQNGKGSS